MNNMSIYPTKYKNKTTDMKLIFIKVLLVIGVAVSLYLSAMVATSGHYWCFKDKDTCTIEEIEYWRGLKEQTNNELTARYNEQMAKSNDYFDNKKINPLKLTLSASAVIKEAKEGDKRNVPAEFFTLKNSLVPIAHADNGDGWIKDVEIKDQDSITTAQGSKKPLRYQALLTSVGSPYADVDIESSCEKAGVEQAQCDILVGIANSESNSGTNFVCSGKTREEAIELGQGYYHNPVGIKDLRAVTERERNHPDSNGCYLRRFSSFNEFWSFYPAHMKKAYFDKGALTASQISKCYVRGDCRVVKPSWVYRVESFTNKI